MKQDWRKSAISGPDTCGAAVEVVETGISTGGLILHGSVLDRSSDHQQNLPQIWIRKCTPHAQVHVDEPQHAPDR